MGADDHAAVVRPDLRRTLTDEALVDAARQGDAAAFGELYTRHALLVRHVVKRRFGLQFDGGVGLDLADIQQDAWLKAWRALAAFDGRAQFKSWVVRIALNAAADALRLLSRRKAIDVHPSDLSVAALLPQPGAIGRVEAGVLARDVRRCLAPLSGRERRMVRAVLVEGQTHREASLTFGMPLGSVKTTLYRARVKMRAAAEAA